MNVDWAWNRDTQNVGYINYTRVMWSDHSYSYDDSAYQVVRPAARAGSQASNTKMGRKQTRLGGEFMAIGTHSDYSFCLCRLCAQTGPPCARRAKRGRRRIR